MAALGRCCECLNCDTAFFCACYERIGDILAHKESFEGESIYLFDSALIAFVKLIRSRASLFDEREVITLFVNALPLFADCEEAPIVTAFLAGLPIQTTIRITDPIKLVSLCLSQIESRSFRPEVDADLRKFISDLISAPGFPRGELAEACVAAVSSEILVSANLSGRRPLETIQFSPSL
jgi:hypothetical protein